MATATIEAKWNGKQTKDGDTIDAQLNVNGWPEMSAKKRKAVVAWLRDQASFLEAGPNIGNTFRARKLTT